MQARTHVDEVTLNELPATCEALSDEREPCQNSAEVALKYTDPDDLVAYCEPCGRRHASRAVTMYEL